MSAIDQQTAYDAQSNTAGPLLGDPRITEIQDQVRNMVQNVVPGVNPHMNNLGDLGITVNNSGQLQVDDTVLTNALSGSNTTFSLSDIGNLFGMAGSSNNPGVQYITGTDQTNASSTPYTVNVTRAATQAAITAGGTIGSQVTIGSNSNTLDITLDGKSSTLTLASGTYTQTALAQLLQSAINGDSDFTGRQISVGVNNNTLTFTSASFGSTSQVAIGSGNANSVLGLSGTESSKGQDVQGNFIVNGVSEPATGIGQTLTGAQANANTSGLVVQVTLSPTQVGSGTQADLTITRGLASQLDGLMNQLTDPQTGRFTQIDTSFNTELTDLKNLETEQTNEMQAKQQQLTTEFANMESTLAQLQLASSAINSLSSAVPTSTTTTKPSSSTGSSSSSGS
jgi:flagellar hook-associated protein 2